MTVRKRASDRERGGDTLFSSLAGAAPLAARMRPRTLEEFAGQAHLLASGKPLRAAIEEGRVGSILFWGPPGSGKTTLARIIATHARAEFVPFSAVTEGVARIREVVEEATRRRASGTGTLLFVDEIHRFNRGQQDALLPHVENGLLTLIGATTENPSFEVNPALLSRMRVFVLQPLSVNDVRGVLDTALTDTDRGLGSMQVRADADALDAIATHANGDARRALSVLEAAADDAGAGGQITAERAREAMQARVLRYDKNREEHYNAISALHKALRGSDPHGALYWLARMLAAGEDPLYVARRMVRFASEDIGLADPQALTISLAARDAYHFLGSPEGELALAEATIYLATAPKSNRAYVAWGEALRLAKEHPDLEVPMHIRNAPTALMKELGYGAGYEYAHDAEDAFTPQTYLPDEIADAVLYEPGKFGFERDIARRLAWWAERRERGAQGGVTNEPTSNLP
ncbi:MAG TPA: replication-associated recombination protein A [Gemmatimonadaceae bacterium]|nr:replication-associated recombination protein A [Gemmatimonadaceae bacterium]